MKKKTIATSLLAILVSTYATPFVSNAEAITGATKDTTEQVAPTTDSEAPAEEVKEEAPTTDSEEAKEEAPVAEKEEVKTPTTKEAPATKNESKTPQNKDFATEVQALYDEGIDIINNQLTTLSPQEQSGLEYVLTNLKNQAITTNDKTQLETFVQNLKDMVSVQGLDFSVELANAIAEIDALHNAGTISDVVHTNAINALNAASTINQINTILADVHNQIATDVPLSNIKEDAKDQLLAWLNDGSLSITDYTHFLNEVVNATDAEAVGAAMANAEQVVEQNSLHTDIDAAKQDAKDQLFELLSYGHINENQYVNGINAINNATSIDEINQIILAIAQEIGGEITNNLENIRQEAKDQLQAWFEDGLLDPSAYGIFISEVLNATTAEEIADVIARAEAHIQASGLVGNLATAQQDAIDQLNAWLVDGTITEDQYYTYLSIVQAATTADEVQAAMNQLTQEINDFYLSQLETERQKALAYLETFTIVSARSTTSGVLTTEQYEAFKAEILGAASLGELEDIIVRLSELGKNNELAISKADAYDQLYTWLVQGGLTPEQYAHYVNEIANATTPELVADLLAAAEQQVYENGLHFDLEAYKDEARGQLVTWVTEGWITEDQYWAYLSLVDVATSKEQVDAALEALLAEIDNADTLENAQNRATDQLIAWLAEGKITEAQYYTYLQRVADATTVAEVNAILAELQAIINGDGEDVTEKPIGTPSINNTNNNANNVNVTLTTTTAGGKVATVTTKEVVRKAANADSSKSTLPKTGEVNQNLTALGLVSVALGSLVAVLKRKRS